MRRISRYFSKYNRAESQTHGKIKRELDGRGRLTIYGDEVFTSTLVNEETQKIITDYEGQDIHTIEVFAFKRIVFDTNIKSSGEPINLIFIAPKWQVQNKEIILNGRDGETQESARNGSPGDNGWTKDGKPGGWVVINKEIDLNGKDGTIHEAAQKTPSLPEEIGESGESGADGSNGRTGGPAGNFFGVLEKITDATKLKIFANGGAGGPGQHGGNGGPGADGESPCWEVGFDKFESKMTSENSVFTFFYNKVDEVYTISGKSGGKGGNAGDGGDGGVGGTYGNITITYLGDDKAEKNIYCENVVGEGGSAGNGGIGGKGGRFGDTVKFRKRRVAFFTPPISGEWEKTPRSTTSSSEVNTSGENGKNGKIGEKGNENNSLCNEYLSVIHYSYLGLVHNKAREFIEKLCKKMESQQIESVKEVIWTLRYLEEQQNLLSKEEQEQKNNSFSKEDKIFIYKTFLKMTRYFSHNGDSEREKVGLYLKTYLTSKIIQLKNDLNGILIVDYDQYFNQLRYEINQVNDGNKKLLTVEKYKLDFDKKIKYADRLICNEVLLKIEIMINDLRKNISTAQESKAKRRKTSFSKVFNILKKSKETERKNQIKSKYYLTVLQTFVSALQFFSNPLVNKLGELAQNAIANLLDEKGDKDSPSTTENNINNDNDVENRKIINKDFHDILKLPNPENKKEYKYEDDDNSKKEYQPILNEMKMKLLETISAAQKRVSLQEAALEIKIYLKEMEIKFKETCQNFEISFICIEEVFTMLYNIYDSIQDYHAQKHQADFIAEIASPRMREIEVADPELQTAIDHLENSIRSNIVLQKYQLAIQALKQFAFPLAFYLPNIKDISTLQAGSLAEVVSDATRQIEKIKSLLVDSKTTVQNQDKHLKYSCFGSDYDATQPFFVWKYSEHKEMIEKLLAGESVMAYADVNKSSKNAVKFNKVALNFKTLGSVSQKPLIKELKKFSVLLTHMGNSYYKIHDAVYVISTQSHVLNTLLKSAKMELLLILMTFTKRFRKVICH